ncbi:MAG: hypothetical protein WA906_07610 [Pacificimonas sp.]
MFQFALLSKPDYSDQAFLDQRMMQQAGRQAQWVGADDVLGVLSRLPKRPTPMILHIGHVGSTLISRLLGALPNVLAVREPQALRTVTLAWPGREDVDSLVSAGQLSQLTAALMSLYARTYADAETAILKATSISSGIADDLLDLNGGAPALALTVSAKTYLATIFGGPASRQEVPMFAPFRRRMLTRFIPDDRTALHEMSEGELVAMSWLAGVLPLLNLPEGRVLQADFDAFLNDPTQCLVTYAKHLGLAARASDCADVVAGPLMSRYSKATEHSYTPTVRADVIADALREHQVEIAKGLAWLETRATRYGPVRHALETLGT